MLQFTTVPAGLVLLPFRHDLLQNWVGFFGGRISLQGILKESRLLLNARKLKILIIIVATVFQTITIAIKNFFLILPNPSISTLTSTFTFFSTVHSTPHSQDDCSTVHSCIPPCFYLWLFQNYSISGCQVVSSVCHHCTPHL